MEDEDDEPGACFTRVVCAVATTVDDDEDTAGLECFS